MSPAASRCRRSRPALPSVFRGRNGRHKGECLRTIPPRENGGNMDVQRMQVGTTLLLPCLVDGCGLFIGEVHHAQGEVSGTAIEMGAGRGRGRDP